MIIKPRHFLYASVASVGLHLALTGAMLIDVSHFFKKEEKKEEELVLTVITKKTAIKKNKKVSKAVAPPVTKLTAPKPPVKLTPLKELKKKEVVKEKLKPVVNKIVQKKLPKVVRKPIIKVKPNPVAKQKVVKPVKKINKTVEKIIPQKLVSNKIIKARPKVNFHRTPQGIDYARALASLLNQRKRYPRTALRRRIQGKVVVFLKISSSGKLISSRIVSSSGYSVLDNEVLSLVSRVVYPPFPKGTKSSSESFQAPILFSIR